MNLAAHSKADGGNPKHVRALLASGADAREPALDVPPASAVREQLARLEMSQVFSGSCRLAAFLRFVVDETLNGAGATLKELVVGEAVYPRHPPYDPRIDSVVRVEARRLRRKLEQHYEGIGRWDPVLISMPPGSYKPSFTTNLQHEDHVASERRQKQPADSPGLMVLPLIALSLDPALAEFADMCTDELITALEAGTDLPIIPRSVVFSLGSRTRSIAVLADEYNVDAVLHGIVRTTSGELSVTIELANAHGFLLASQRFELVDGVRADVSAIFRGLACNLGNHTATAGLSGSLMKVRSAA